MKFFKGYKYQLSEDMEFFTDIKPKHLIVDKRIRLYSDGTLIVSDGYAWDGASGPVVDRKSNYAASCGHDALAELMRKGLLKHHWWVQADKEYIRILRDRGKANRLTCWLDAKGLAIVQGSYALPKNRKKEYYVP